MMQMVMAGVMVIAMDILVVAAGETVGVFIGIILMTAMVLDMANDTLANIC